MTTTLGVEEEYLLIDPVTGRLVAQSVKVRAAAGLEPFVAAHEIQAELLQAQVEVATPVCATLAEVGGHLLRLRHAVSEAAEAHGCRLAAGGTPALGQGLPVPVTEHVRYRAMQRQAPQLVAEQLVNGMHVHVAVADRQMGVEVLNRIRGWLPILTAMAANSPLWQGHDTGFASWRTVVFDRWPVSGVPPLFADEADYDRRVRRLLAAGVIGDTGQLYWQARLSERYPTVEVRCLDVQLRTDDAVMFAGLVRALVETAAGEATAGVPVPEWEPELAKAAMWQAARHGLGGYLIDPRGLRCRAGDAVFRLLQHVGPALEAAGDLREVDSLVHRLLRRGTGADQQRRALATGGLAAVNALLTGAEADGVS
ncbi:glutamate--cysteine ligase [Streptomyces echinoruber]|uniref:Putative glutamate--cysteine ligase 2 n=1 Tax=Streptomyces echinoruber TaxID=68898 RepID=A0A918RA41_9ACTN|nr:glutamate--cysteine ligase [Streptomyces echinoruber]GGZ91619.1 putative glutamate--cysteine ligase 2 [Streptomyces echinoruber]